MKILILTLTVLLASFAPRADTEQNPYPMLYAVQSKAFVGTSVTIGDSTFVMVGGISEVDRSATAISQTWQSGGTTIHRSTPRRKGESAMEQAARHLESYNTVVALFPVDPPTPDPGD